MRNKRLIELTTSSLILQKQGGHQCQRDLVLEILCQIFCRSEAACKERKRVVSADLAIPPVQVDKLDCCDAITKLVIDKYSYGIRLVLVSTLTVLATLFSW